MIKTDLLINDINNSNCYIIQDKKKGKCIIIDPGGRDISFILEFLKEEKLNLDYIFLTHSHFDHMAGVALLVKNCGVKIISSELCSEKIVDPVKNLSYFSEIGSIFSPKADIFIENLNDGNIAWSDYIIKCFNTPGHSSCSICIQIENMLFVGDTIIKGFRTKITQPDGDRDELNHSLYYIYKTIPPDFLIFPGHGDSFPLGKQDITISLNKQITNGFSKI